MTRREITDNLDELLEVLPPRLRDELEGMGGLDDLLEIVLDLGMLPEARFQGSRFVYLDENPIKREDIEFITKRVGAFGHDNRAGIERTLHRISGIRNRYGDIFGLTCRIGRAVYGTIDVVRDVVEQEKSILLLGKPGVGKTTLLREVARVLSDEFHKRVVIVDTSNEIAGDGDIPHPAIGRARRMQVPTPQRQADVMIEAVENHMPEVIVIDEIGTEAEAQAARTIAERGVQLIGTAHGNTLENLVLNPTLSDLVGGIQAVTLGDEEARKRGTQKTVLERKAPPTFDVVIEILDRDGYAIHHDVAKTVDLLLRGIPPRPEIRRRSVDGEIKVIEKERLNDGAVIPSDESERYGFNVEGDSETVWISPDMIPRKYGNVLRLFPFAVSRKRIESAIRDTGFPVVIAKDLGQADIVLTLKGQYRKMPKTIREAEKQGLPVYIIRSNTVAQITNFLRQAFDKDRASGEEKALKEAEDAISRVWEFDGPVELNPQNSYLRRLQHELASRYNVKSVSIGQEPNRRVVYYKG
ncbi:MAG: R3H domain-containing nucleic acid-binding protein [Bacillota bacterium]